MGGEGVVAKTCRQQGEFEPDTPALNSYFWLLGARTPGLQHEKKTTKNHKGIELKAWKTFKILQKTWSVLFVLFSDT